MLNGIDPVIIFQISKLAGGSYSQAIQKIPYISKVKSFIDQPPVPIYLSETLTGLYIDSEDKNVDINTDVETLPGGGESEVNQTGIGSTVSINLLAKKGSVGITLLSAMIDLIFDKTTSKEYTITYMHGATTIFRGLITSYQVNQNSDNDLLRIKIDITKGQKNPKKPETINEAPKFEGTRLSPNIGR